MNRMLRIVAVMILLAATTAAAQTSDEKQLKAAVKTIFEQIDRGDMQKLESLVDEEIEVFDSVYLLRIDGWEDLEDYLTNLRGIIDALKTSIRQSTVRVIGSVGIVNFYYSQDYIVARERAIGELDEMLPGDEGPIMGEWTNEIGRGTIVFVRTQNTWKAITMHQSQLPHGFFE